MDEFTLRLLRRFSKTEAIAGYETSVPGSEAWLIGAEVKYGGLVMDVKRNKFSPLDLRTTEQFGKVRMMGGDRMHYHGYAEAYAAYLEPFLAREERLTIAEFGVLYGSGLGIWSELFPTSRLLGFDIEVDYVLSNLDHLRSLGAFAHGAPEIYEFDQLVDNLEYLSKILDGDKIDVCTDDGFHSSESILRTLHNVRPYLADEFVYFVEDNEAVHEDIRQAFPEFETLSFGELAVVRPRSVS